MFFYKKLFTFRHFSFIIIKGFYYIKHFFITNRRFFYER